LRGREVRSEMSGEVKNTRALESGRFEFASQTGEGSPSLFLPYLR